MKALIEWTCGIGLIAVLHFVTNLFQIEFLTIFNNTPQMAVFYVPAAVRVFSAMVFGYWAGLGIALGVLALEFFVPILQFNAHEMTMNMLQQGIGVSLSLLIWAYTSKKVTRLANPQIDFLRINAFDVFQICFIQAVLNSVSAHIFYIWSPTIHLQFDWHNFVVMLVGDLTGSFFIFISANIIFSLLKRTPFFPHRHYDETINGK